MDRDIRLETWNTLPSTSSRGRLVLLPDDPVPLPAVDFVEELLPAPRAPWILECSSVRGVLYDVGELSRSERTRPEVADDIE